MKRRTVLASVGTTTAAVATAGCVSVDPGGTTDVVVTNCLDGDQADGDGDRSADLRIRDAERGDSVLDERVTVPGMSCSDVVDGVRREDVFPEAGTYTVAVSVDGYDRTEGAVEFSERLIEDNSDNVLVTIRADGIEIV